MAVYEQDVETRWRSRKWLLTCACLVMLNVALFTGFVDGGLYIQGMAIILGVYSAANFAIKREMYKKEQ